MKQSSVLNGVISDVPGVPGVPGFPCVVCNYGQPGGGVPALSLLGTAILFGGMITAAFYEFRKRQNKPASA